MIGVQMSKKVPKGTKTKFQIIDGILRFRGKVYVPINDKFKDLILL